MSSQPSRNGGAVLTMAGAADTQTSAPTLSEMAANLQLLASRANS
jgi:hypothetical protein